MNPAPSLNPVPILLAYAQGSADLPDVMRALIAYDGWLAPVGNLHEPRPDVLDFETTPEFPPDELWLFTDEDAARFAATAGSRLGQLARGRRGRELFSRIDPAWKYVRVNPVSTAEKTWNFPTSSFPLIAAWCKALELEDHLRDMSGVSPAQDRRFSEYPHFTVYLLDDGTILTMPNQANMKNPAVVVTAPDCGRRILQLVPEAMRSRLNATETNGAELVQKLPSQGVDGLLLNPAGPGPTYAVHFSVLQPEPAR